MKAAYLGHQELTTKKGDDMTILYYSYVDAQVKGKACEKAFIFANSGIKLPDKLTEGAALELDFNQRGNLTSVELDTPFK